MEYNNMSISVSQLANDYFSLTGRPISTMTVEEYATFYKLASEASGFFVRKEFAPENIIKKEKEPHIVENDPVNLEKESSFIKEEKASDTLLPLSKKKETHVADSNIALSMLRSVSG